MLEQARLLIRALSFLVGTVVLALVLNYASATKLPGPVQFVQVHPWQTLAGVFALGLCLNGLLSLLGSRAEAWDRPADPPERWTHRGRV